MESECKKYSCIVEGELKALGTDIKMQIIVDEQGLKKNAERDLTEAREKYFFAEKIFSRFDSKSELARLNKNLGKFNKVSEAMVVVAGRILDYYKKTEGIFDPRIIVTLESIGYDRDFQFVKSVVVSEYNLKEALYRKNLAEDLIVQGNKIYFGAKMDFSGIAKGYITDGIVRFLKERGWKNFFVNSGGDIYFSGKNETDAKWQADIEGVAQNKILLELSEAGVATTGIGKRKWKKNGQAFHHLVNPKNPKLFAFETKAVTVVAASTEEADVWAKTLFLLGNKKRQEVVITNKIPCLVLGYRGNVWVSPLMKKYLYQNNI